LAGLASCSRAYITKHIAYISPRCCCYCAPLRALRRRLRRPQTPCIFRFPFALFFFSRFSFHGAVLVFWFSSLSSAPVAIFFFFFFSFLPWFRAPAAGAPPPGSPPPDGHQWVPAPWLPPHTSRGGWGAGCGGSGRRFGAPSGPFRCLGSSGVLVWSLESHRNQLKSVGTAWGGCGVGHRHVPAKCTRGHPRKSPP
jgi:hypothetical protein